MGLLSSKEYRDYKNKLMKARKDKDYVKVYNLEGFSHTFNVWDGLPTFIQIFVILAAPIYFIVGIISPFLIKYG